MDELGAVAEAANAFRMRPGTDVAYFVLTDHAAQSADALVGERGTGQSSQARKAPSLSSGPAPRASTDREGEGLAVEVLDVARGLQLQMHARIERERLAAAGSLTRVGPREPGTVDAVRGTRPHVHVAVLVPDNKI